MDTNPIVTVEFSVEPAEYQEAYAALKRFRQLSPAFMIGPFAVMLVLAVWVVFRDFISGVLVLLILLVLVLTLRLFVKKMVAKAGSELQVEMPVTLTFTDAGVTGKTKFSESFRQWAGFRGYLETQNTLVLLPNSRVYTVMPKRALSAEQAGVFWGLLAAKLQRL